MNYSDVIERLSGYSPKFYIFSGATTSAAASSFQTFKDMDLVILFSSGFIGALGAGLAKILVTNINIYIEKRRKEKELFKQYMKDLESKDSSNQKDKSK